MVKCGNIADRRVYITVVTCRGQTIIIIVLSFSSAREGQQHKNILKMFQAQNTKRKTRSASTAKLDVVIKRTQRAIQNLTSWWEICTSRLVFFAKLT